MSDLLKLMVTNAWVFFNQMEKTASFLKLSAYWQSKEVMVLEKKKSTKPRMFLYIATATNQLCPKQCTALATSSKAGR